MKYYEGFEGSEDITNGHLVNCMNYCYQFYNKVLELANSQETIIHDTQPERFIDDMEILKFIHQDNVYRQDYLDREDGMINSYDYCRFNNDSVVILSNYNKLQMLLTADIERETWQNNGVEVIANENEWNIY